MAEGMHADVEHEPEQGDAGGHQVVTIHDEDAGGAPIRINAQREAKVAEVIEALYKHLNTPRADGDRLRCEGNGEDVFAHTGEELDSYARQHCTKLEWLWARKTGGA